MSYYNVTKTINGISYLYQQRTFREGDKVRTESNYIGPASSQNGKGSPKTTGGGIVNATESKETSIEEKN